MSEESSDFLEDAGAAPHNTVDRYLRNIGAVSKPMTREEQLAATTKIRADAIVCAKQMMKRLSRRAQCSGKSREPEARKTDPCSCRTCFLFRVFKGKKRRDLKSALVVLSDYPGRLLNDWGPRGSKQSFDRFAEANLRLVVSMARILGAKSPLKLEDRVQYGNIGLFKAIIRFEPERGFAFSTYATQWIRQSISRSLADYGRTIRYPVHMIGFETKIRRASDAFWHAHSRAPSDKELAELVTKESVERAQEVELRKPGTNQRVAVVTDENIADHRLASTPEPVSLSTPVSELQSSGDPLTLEDVVSDEKVVDTSVLLERSEVIKIIQSCLLSLTQREQDVIRRRFGLNDSEEMETLREVGGEYGLSRERVRQVQASALSKLKKALKKRGIDGIPF